MRKREEAFAKAMAALDYISRRRFESDKPRIEHLYNDTITAKPKTVYARAVKDIMQYGTQFEERDRNLMDKSLDHVNELGIEGFTDDPLHPVYLMLFTQEHAKLKSEIDKY